MTETYIGEIKAFPFPDFYRAEQLGFILCNGAKLPVNEHQSLFAIIGNRFGGNGQTTFAVPNLMGRTPLCISFDDQVEVGASGGAESVALKAENLPAHGHTAPPDYLLYQSATTEQGDLNAPVEGSYPSTMASADPDDIAMYLPANAPKDRTLAPMTVAADANLPVFNTGQGKEASNMQPYLGMAYYIAFEGVFPARN